jgi:importin subunit beta-1
MDAMKSSHDEIALQGIEFWSNVCDEEYELQLLQQEVSPTKTTKFHFKCFMNIQAQEQSRQPERTSRYYARGALPYLVPVLLQRLTMQEESDDDDDWNPCKAAGVCLMLLANCAENTIIQYVFPFVSENIKHTNWQHREAAVMAFGSMLEGPDVSSIKPIAEQAIPFLLELLRDQNIAVRDTTAWTIGRIFEFVSQAVMNHELLRAIGNALVNGLGDVPRVATNICWVGEEDKKKDKSEFVCF